MFFLGVKKACEGGRPSRAFEGLGLRRVRPDALANADQPRSLRPAALDGHPHLGKVARRHSEPTGKRLRIHRPAGARRARRRVTRELRQ